MNPFERVRVELLALVPRSVRVDTREDVVNAAVEAALAASTHVRNDPEAMLAEAKAQLTRILKDNAWKRKRGRSVPLNEAAVSPIGQQPVRRQRKQRLPAGLAIYRSSDVGEMAVGTGIGDTANEATRRAAERLAHQDLLRIASGEPCSRRAAQLIQALYRELKGVYPDAHWAFLLVEELERAKRQALSNPEANYTPPATSTVTLKPLAVSKAKPISKPAVIVETPTTRGRYMRQAYIEENGRHKLVGTAVGTTDLEFLYSSDPSTRAVQILRQVRLKLAAETYVPQQLPAFADDPQLVAWLYERLGFEGGGGASAVKTKTLKEWLSSPMLLAEALDRHTVRSSERLDDAAAEALQQWAALAVAKIRSATAAEAQKAGL